MLFQVRTLIVWPKDGQKPRMVEFRPGKLNIISGASKTGKSAIIPILDYCLGSRSCSIPVGVIRERAAWFGVVIDTIEGQKLFARKEPGDQRSTDDMYFQEAPEIDISEGTPVKSTNRKAIKLLLDRLAALPQLDFEPDSDSGYKARPSFRDLVAFNFQPQNVVANPSIMFYKADRTEHREKLKTIFPFVLGAVTAEILQARHEMERLSRILRRKESELRSVEAASSRWQVEAQGWLRQAIELGLIDPTTKAPTDWNSVLSLLRSIVENGSSNARPTIEGIDGVLERISVLRERETNVAASLSENRRRLAELKRLHEASEHFGESLRIQRERLDLANWISGIGKNIPDTISAISGGDAGKIQQLCEALEGLDVQIKSLPNISSTLDRENLRRRAQAETDIESLTSIRDEIAELEKQSEDAQTEAFRFDRVERFLGRLEQALELYDKSDESSHLREQVNTLKQQIDELRRTISETQIQRKLRNVLSQLQQITGEMIPTLDAEWPDSPIRLVVDELTVQVIRGDRDDFLWEIGSGANWVAYHVSLMLGLQRVFLETPHHPVGGLLVFDQPSQVYFPKRAVDDGLVDSTDLRDEDILAVQKIFKLIQREVAKSQGRLQAIVLDHADQEVWGDVSGVHLVEEWRGGNALIPSAWLE